jgi:hypothetical protein
LKKNSLIDLSTETLTSFSINSNPASFLSNRFSIVLQPNKVLPLLLTGVRAYKKETGIQVEWITQTETGIEKYEIEKSVNGFLFEKEQTVAAKNNANVRNDYRWFDANAISGNNFYRIKCIQKNGEVFYSKQAVVNVAKNVRIIEVFPNPVKGNSFNLRIKDLEKGDYTIALVNSLGETILVQKIKYNRLTEQYKINIGKAVSKGNYSLTITNGSETFFNNLIID